MNNLNHYKTVYLNTLDNGDIVFPNEGDMAFVNTHYVTWCDTFAKIGPLFMNAELKSKLTDMPARCVILFPDYYTEKFKEDDKETLLSRVEFVINKMVVPKNGMIISMYSLSEQKLYDSEFGVTWPFSTSHKWNLKDSWTEDKTENYVTFQKTEPGSYLQGRDYHLGLEKDILDFLKDKVEIKYISYSDSNDYIYNTILKSKRHFSYIGASWWVSMYLNTPTVSYGCRVNKTRFFGAQTNALLNPRGSPEPLVFEDGRFKNREVNPPGIYTMNEKFLLEAIDGIS